MHGHKIRLNEKQGEETYKFGFVKEWGANPTVRPVNGVRKQKYLIFALVNE